MKKIKIIASEKPILFSILLILVTGLLTDIKIPFSQNQYGLYITGIIEQGLVSIVLVALINSLKLLDESGLTKFCSWKRFFILWPAILIILMNVSPLFDGTLIIDTSKPVLIILYVLLYCSTGVFEEVLCRGIMLNLLRKKFRNYKKGIYISVMLSSIIFGVAHLDNFLANRESLLVTIIQIIYATFLGIFFAACYIRTESIWAVVILHAIVDIAGSFNEISVDRVINSNVSQSISDVIGGIIFCFLFALYGFFILRKVQINKPKSYDARNDLQVM